MASAGDVLENPVTGQRLIVRRTAGETGGEVLEVESVYSMPTPFPPTAHYHPYQEERFEVLSGEVRARIDGAERRYGAGETFTIPPGTPHTMWAEQGGARFNWQTRPALNTEAFFEKAWGLAKAGKVNERGVPNLLQAAVIGRDHADEYRLAVPPWPIQRALLAALAPIGRLLGHDVSVAPASSAAQHPTQDERTAGSVDGLNAWTKLVGEWAPRSASRRLAVLAGVGLVLALGIALLRRRD